MADKRKKLHKKLAALVEKRKGKQVEKGESLFKYSLNVVNACK